MMSVWLQMTSNGMVDDEGTEIMVPFTRKDGRIAEVRCDIQKTQDNMIELGQQYLKYFGYSLTMGEDTIDSRTSPIATDPQEANFVYNMPAGQDLRSHLSKTTRFLKQRRIAKLADWPPKTESRTIVITKRRRSSSQNSE